MTGAIILLNQPSKKGSQSKGQPDLVVSQVQVTTPALDPEQQYDILVGDSSGKLSRFSRKGGLANPRFDAPGLGIFVQAGSTALDVEDDATPTAGDLDDDGLFDLVVGGRDPSLPATAAGRLFSFRNNGSPGSPLLGARQRIQADGRDVSFEAGAQPSLGDIDGDGDLDLVVGDGKGKVVLLKNTGTAAQAAFALPAAITADGAPIALVDGGTPVAAFPLLVDLDLNGLPDLLVGGGDGLVRFFKNNGTATQPAFTAAGNLQENTPAPLDAGNDAAPAVVDFDLDGDLDLILGNRDGNVLVFRNKDIDAVAGDTVLDGFVFLPGVKIQTITPAADIDVGTNARPLVRHFGAVPVTRFALKQAPFKTTLKAAIALNSKDGIALESAVGLPASGRLRVDKDGDLMAYASRDEGAGTISGLTGIDRAHAAGATVELLGPELRVACTVVNQGNLEAPKSKVKFLLRSAKRLQQVARPKEATEYLAAATDKADADIPLGEVEVGAMAIGEGQTLDNVAGERREIALSVPLVNPNLPSEDADKKPIPEAQRALAEGTYFIVALADSAGAVGEEKEDNNQGVSDLPVFVRALEATDDQVAVSAAGAPGFCVAGQGVFPVDFTVVNRSAVDITQVKGQIILLDERDVLTTDLSTIPADRAVAGNAVNFTLQAQAGQPPQILPAGALLETRQTIAIPVLASFGNTGIGAINPSQNFHFIVVLTATTPAIASLAANSAVNGDDRLPTALATHIGPAQPNVDQDQGGSIPNKGVKANATDQEISQAGGQVVVKFPVGNRVNMALGVIPKNSPGGDFVVTAFEVAADAIVSYVGTDDDNGIGSQAFIGNQNFSTKEYRAVVKTFRNLTQGSFDLIFKQFVTAGDQNKVFADVLRDGIIRLDDLSLEPNFVNLSTEFQDNKDFNEFRFRLGYNAKVKLVFRFSFSLTEQDILDILIESLRQKDTDERREQDFELSVDGRDLTLKESRRRLEAGIYFLRIENQTGLPLTYDLILDTTVEKKKKEESAPSTP